VVQQQQNKEQIMETSNATADRKTFDAWTKARLEKCIDDPQKRERAIERQYPRTTAQAVAELRTRGWNAHELHAERFAELIGVETFGNSLAWYPSDIDQLAEALENRPMIGTRHRIARGISWEQDHAD
jgi:hypothetical protein